MDEDLQTRSIPWENQQDVNPPSVPDGSSTVEFRSPFAGHPLRFDPALELPLAEHDANDAVFGDPETVDIEVNDEAEPAPQSAEDQPVAIVEPFDRPDTQKLGIIGGRGVGKTYLFQSMVYRTFAGPQAGALTYYLEKDGMHLFEASREAGDGKIVNTGSARPVNRVDFIRRYQAWHRLPTTTSSIQQWYRLRLLYRTGYFGELRSAIDVEFFDVSGELLGSQADEGGDWAVWAKAYCDANVMVFCLPLWAAFPSSDLTVDESRFRDIVMTSFEQVIRNYTEVRRRFRADHPVRSILALTMSDDRRSALRSLYDRWISPYLDSPYTYLKQLQTGSGVARYLANARKVSELMHDEFAAARDPQIASIPQTLDFGRGRPWIVPLSAIDGTYLDDLNDRYPDPDDPARFQEARRNAPVPVHVELPLLVALCERENALM
jgi:hypothetical protein